MNDNLRIQTSDLPLPRILDLICRCVPYAAKVQGEASLEWIEGKAFRWFCGLETVVVFSLPSEVPLVLRIDFENVLHGQSLCLMANDTVLVEHRDMPNGQQVQGAFHFAGKMENVITVRCGTTSKVSGAFSEDPRALSIMCREFVVLPVAPSREASWGSRLACLIKMSGLGGRENVLRSDDAAHQLLMPLAPDRFSLESIVHLGDPEANAKLNQSEYENGVTVLHSLPSVVTLALTTHCNNRTPCMICDRNTRPAICDSEIDAEMLEKAKPLLKTAQYVLLHCGGESMFSRHFDDVIASIEPPTRVSFATNAMLLTNKRTDKMLEKDIMAGFVVSMDAATCETYEIMRPGSKFDTVVSNVAYYIEQTKRLGRTESNITLNMTLCAANIHEASALVDLAAAIGAWGVDYNHLNAGLTHVARTSAGWDWNYGIQAQFTDKDYHDRMLLEAYYKAKEKGINFSLVGRPFLGPNAEKYQDILCDMTCQVAFQEGEAGKHWNSPFHKKIATNVPSCFKPWQETVIQPDGSVRACYFHETSQWAVGHMKAAGFMHIWNSDQMVLTRKQFYEHAFARSCAESQPCMHRGRE